jgi:hypothetical protein
MFIIGLNIGDNFGCERVTVRIRATKGNNPNSYNAAFHVVYDMGVWV